MSGNISLVAGRIAVVVNVIKDKSVLLIGPPSPLHIHYKICQCWDYIYGLMTLGCLPGLDCFVLDLFYYRCAVRRE